MPCSHSAPENGQCPMTLPGCGGSMRQSTMSWAMVSPTSTSCSEGADDVAIGAGELLAGARVQLWHDYRLERSSSMWDILHPFSEFAQRLSRRANQSPVRRADFVRQHPHHTGLEAGDWQ